MFDANKKENLSPSMRTAIAQLMQYAVLDEIFSGGIWETGDIAFQGGTSLHVVHNSPRFSEDLDFMIDVERSTSIDRVMAKTARELQKRLSLALPRSEIRLKSGGGTAGSLRDVLRHDVVWSHPAKNGSVRVRTEFFTVERAHLAAYEIENRRHRPDPSNIAARPELNGFDIKSLTVNALIPAATTSSIYGDKMVALAKRDYLKARDFYDLWWLQEHRDVSLDSDALYSAMRRSADCYTYEDHDVSRGLSRLMQNPKGFAKTLEDNLSTFLPEAVHKRILACNGFEKMYFHVMSEAERLSSTMLDRNGPEILP